MAKVLEGNEIRFPQGWIKDEAQEVVVLEKGDAGPSFAVREVPSDKGPMLELLTKQTNQTTGEVQWMPARTPCQDFPERVIQEAGYRQSKIGKSWTLDGSQGVLVHKDGTFAARTLEGSNGKLELLTRQGPEGAKAWASAKNPCTGTAEQVFREAGNRQLRMNLIHEGKALPPGWDDKKRDFEGKRIAIHPAKNFAVRSAGDGKMELLTPHMHNGNWAWKPADKPFVGMPKEMYAEITHREYGLQKGKEAQAQGRGQAKPVEKAQQQTKAQDRAVKKGKGREL